MKSLLKQAASVLRLVSNSLQILYFGLFFSRKCPPNVPQANPIENVEQFVNKTGLNSLILQIKLGNAWIAIYASQFFYAQ